MASGALLYPYLNYNANSNRKHTKKGGSPMHVEFVALKAADSLMVLRGALFESRVVPRYE